MNLKQELIKQKESKFKGSIYHFSQVSFAFNSNKIEGSKLSEEQTEEIFETNSLVPTCGEQITSDDLIETKNHFRLFDYMLDIVDDKLTKDIIIKVYSILKTNTSDYEEGFKKLSNTIGIINSVHTSKPEDVENDIEELLNWYNELKNITLEDIIEFHVRFETIHPFNDGNGRVGRVIMFKECLKNNIMPFIILDQHKSFYLRGLKEYKNDKLFLIDTIKNEQDTYETICNDLLECDLEINI